jgi:hypothetical protein
MSVARELRRRLRAEQSQPRFEPCLPRSAKEPPAGRGWIHEIKHDGFRILAHRQGRSASCVLDGRSCTDTVERPEKHIQRLVSNNADRARKLAQGL